MLTNKQTINNMIEGLIWRKFNQFKEVIINKLTINTI